MSPTTVTDVMDEMKRISGVLTDAHDILERNVEYCAMARERIRREGRLVQPSSITRPDVEELRLFT